MSLQVVGITAWGKNFTPSATQGSQVSPSPVNDGSLLTWCRSPNGTNWWFLDFGTPVDLRDVTLYEDGFRTGGSLWYTDDPAWTDFTKYLTASTSWSAPGSNTYTSHAVNGGAGVGAHRYWAVQQSNKLQWADAIFTAEVSSPVVDGTWRNEDGTEWTPSVRLARRISSTADEYGTANYGGARYGGYSTEDQEDATDWIVGAVQVQRGMNHFRDQVRPSVCRLLLDNTDGRWSDTATHYTKPGDRLEVAMVVDTGTPDYRPIFFGRIDQAREIMTPVGLELLEIIAYDCLPDLASIETPGEAAVGAGETTDERFRRLVEASSAVVNDSAVHHVGENVNPTCQATDLSDGRLDEMRKVWQYEGGYWWQQAFPSQYTGGARGPRLVRAGRNWHTVATRSTVSQATFGGVSGIGITDAQPSRERSRVVNRATYANQGGTPQTYSDDTPALIAQYGPAAISVTGLPGDTDSEALTLATAVVNALKDAGASPAIRSLVVPVVDGASMDAATELELLDLVTYDVEGLAGWASGLSGDSHVIGIQHVIAGGTWDLTLTLDDTYA